MKRLREHTTLRVCLVRRIREAQGVRHGSEFTRRGDTHCSEAWSPESDAQTKPFKGTIDKSRRERGADAGIEQSGLVAIIHATGKIFLIDGVCGEVVGLYLKSCADVPRIGDIDRPVEGVFVNHTGLGELQVMCSVGGSGTECDIPIDIQRIEDCT